MSKKKNEELKKKLSYENKNGWDLSGTQKDKVFKFAEKYKEFIGSCKTERETVDFVLDEFEKKKKKNDITVINRGKNIALIRLGSEKGMKLIASHIDAPRIDIKQKPLFEETDIALLHTHYYGGIKKYQWFNIPLAVHGVVVKENGEKINITIGEDDSDPVFVIPDLLPHLSHKVIENEFNRRKHTVR